MELAVGRKLDQQAGDGVAKAIPQSRLHLGFLIAPVIAFQTGSGAGKGDYILK